MDAEDEVEEIEAPAAAEDEDIETEVEENEEDEFDGAVSDESPIISYITFAPADDAGTTGRISEALVRASITFKKRSQGTMPSKPGLRITLFCRDNREKRDGHTKRRERGRS